MQRLATDVMAETTVSVVPIPSDDMKGRIIGREGRNIRALEAATGVDLIIDDTPEAVTLSAFDPVRREIARVALTRLIATAASTPRASRRWWRRRARRWTRHQGGRRAGGRRGGLSRPAPGDPEDPGPPRYRTSYGQNLLKHAIETAHIAGDVAEEIGAESTSPRGGLLHDIGKAIDHEVEGTHALIGADLARRYGVSPAVVHCIAAHHEEVEPRTVEAVLVQIADAISGGRPGARRETLEHYIKRLEALEDHRQQLRGRGEGLCHPGRPRVRIIVKPEEIDDLAAMRLARDISQKIEETLEYPGQIKVTVVRETRAVDYAK